MNSYWLNLSVTDVERALNFYRNIGFEIIDERSNNETLGAIKIGDNTICIFKQDILEQFMQTPLKTHADKPEIIVSFDLPTNQDVDELYERIVQAGGNVINKPSVKNGYYGFMFTDVDGHYFNVIVM